MTIDSTIVRKRSNTIIPFEFRNDTSDGGMERAALATVFGVKEYTESKIFWNADEESILDKPVLLQRSSSKKSYTTIRSTQPTFNREKSLPIIPAVSEFGDIWSETNFDNQSTQQLVQQQGLPEDLSDCPLSLFDLIESDQNTNIILWSTNSNIEEEGYASSIDGKKKKLRWSKHQFSISKLKKKSSSSAFAVSNPTIQETRIIEAATIEKLIEKLTISLDYTFMTDFFLIFRVFMTPLQLCKFLILRFKWSIENNDEKRCIVRIRTFVVMRHWLLNYFLHDFVPSRELRITLTSFLNSMPFHPLIKQSPRDQRIIKGLKRVVRRLKKLYYASSSSRVQVIGPPPLTDEQEQIQAMAREKISQTTIRQKTLNRVNGIHVDVRHSNNTAIKNKQAAPVVVIGTSNSNKTEKQSRTRRRGSSTSSFSNPNIKALVSNHSLPTSLYNMNDGANDSATKEWNNLKQQKENDHQISKSQDFHISNVSDSSLESMLSPGTSAEVSDYDDDDEDDEDDDQDDEDNSLSKASFHSKTIPDPSNTSSAPQFVSNELTEKLERLCQQQQEEVDEKTEAEIFLAAYSANPAAATAAIVHKTQSNFEDGLRKRPFYNAQLAVPSAISTPDIYHPQQQHYFESPTNGDGMINSMSYNSMAYPSVTDSEVVTPSIEPAIDTGRTRLRSSSFNQDRSKLLPLFPINHYQNKRLSKTWIDPKVKPLPLLVVADELPISKKKKDDKVEQWRMSVHQQESSPTKAKETQPSLKHSESNLTENTAITPKSKIIELDLDLQNHLLSKLPPSLPMPTQFQQKSIVLSYSTSLMAQQFCLIEKAVLLDIDWEELVDCKWTKMSASSSYQPQNNNSNGMTNEEVVKHLSIPTSSIADPVQGIFSRTKRMKQQDERNNDGAERGIEKTINRFNAVCQWVSSEIVQTKQLDQRVKLIEKFIRLAKKCKLYFNFATLLQILLGLQSSSVSRLSKTWPLVNKREMKTLQELSAFTSPTKNWKNIRDSMSQVAEEFGESPTEVQVEVDTSASLNRKKKKGSVTIKLPFGGCIPFLGIYLSDLVFNAELPSYLPSNNAKKPQGMADVALSQPLVHFRKHRITATVIKRVLVFQNLARRYAFEESTDAVLYSSCFQVASLCTDAIQKMSYEIEPANSN